MAKQTAAFILGSCNNSYRHFFGDGIYYWRYSNIADIHKNHIAIDVDTRMILNYAANRDPKYNTQFAITSIRKLQPYKPHHTLADKAYDTEPIRKCINEEVGAFDQNSTKEKCKNRSLQTQ